MISFVTDQNEVIPMTITGATATTAETMLAPGGIVGFSLDFRQIDCT